VLAAIYNGFLAAGLLWGLFVTFVGLHRQKPSATLPANDDGRRSNRRNRIIGRQKQKGAAT
jgi:hypothetical protein